MSRNKNTSMHRRILTLALSLALALVLFALPTGFSAQAAEPTTEINILSFNDYHGQVESSSSRGGAARFSAIMNKLKADYPNAYVLCNGDNYQGSAVSNYYLGKPISDMLKAMGVEYSSIGNHEFDWGADKISQFAADGDITFLCSNLFLKGTDDRPDFCEPYAIKEIAGKKIGIVGYIVTSTPTLVKAEYVADFDFRGPGQWLRDIVTDLRDVQGCDAVIALSHDGGSSLSGYGFNAIINGHSHSNSISTSGGVPTIQSGSTGSNIGRLKFVFDNETGAVTVTATNTASNALLLTNSSILAANVVDEALKEKVDWYLADSAALFDKVCGQADIALPNQSTVNNWATRLVYDFVLRKTGTPYVVIQNSGGWRSMTGLFLQEGDDITYRWLNVLMPFDNEIVLMDLPGNYLIHALNGKRANGTSNVTGSPVIAGATKSGNDWYLSDGTKIEPTGTYKVSCNDFMQTGGDNYDMFQYGTDAFYLGDKLRDAMADEIGFRSAPPKVYADVRVEAFSDIKQPVAYTVSLEGMKNVLNARFFFEVDADMLEGLGMEMLSDAFTALGLDGETVRWSNQDKIWTGELLLMNFDSEGFTSDTAVDLVTGFFRAKQLGNASLKLTRVVITGLDEDGNVAFLESEIRTAEAVTSVIKIYSIYDLNKDEVVDERDLAMAQRYYQATTASSNWETARVCDFDSDGDVDMVDLVNLFLHFGVYQ